LPLYRFGLSGDVIAPRRRAGDEILPAPLARGDHLLCRDEFKLSPDQQSGPIDIRKNFFAMLSEAGSAKRPWDGETTGRRS
jgi:hypothetical protein